MSPMITHLKHVLMIIRNHVYDDAAKIENFYEQLNIFEERKKISSFFTTQKFLHHVLNDLFSDKNMRIRSTARGYSFF